MAMFFGSWRDPIRSALDEEVLVGRDSTSIKANVPKPDFAASSLRFLEINVRSLRANKHKFTTLLAVQNPDVFVAVETWLCNEINDASLFPPGYSIFRNDRNSHGGGVLIGIRDNLTSSLIFSDSIFEFLICSFYAADIKCFVVGAYRPPDENSGIFNTLNSQFQKLKIFERSSPVFVLGDFNLPSVRWASGLISQPAAYGPAVNNIAIDFFSSYNLKQIVCQPTRVTVHSANILDLIFVRKPEAVENLSVEDGVSDHKIVVFESKIRCARPEPIKKNITLYQMFLI